MIESLREKSQLSINRQNLNFKRSLIDKISWENRLIGILGARGSGKTTLLLQRIKEFFGLDERAVYLSLDDLYFSENGLTETVREFRLAGVKCFFLDEVHKYKDWDREIKNIYDFNPDLSIVFTGSSIIDLLKLQVDLSRRALVYHLSGLSFREFLALNYGLQFPVLSLDQVLSDHIALAGEIINKNEPLKLFKPYTELGYYPFFKENEASYLTRLESTIRLIVEYDLAFIENIEVSNIQKILRLLVILASQVPFTPNISTLSEQLGMARNTLVIYLSYLEKSKLINTLYVRGKGLSKLAKPGKILLENPNLFYALSPSTPDKGSLRETVFVSQMKNMAYKVELPERGDVLVNDRYTFEIGGRNKGYHQIAGIADSYIVADELEIGTKNKIPLWMFGFLY